MSVFHEWFKDRRSVLKLTQAQIATRLGINQGQISGIEIGKIKPDNNLLKKIYEAFGTFNGAYIPMQPVSVDKKVMSDKTKEALRTYREAKEEAFNLQLDENTSITADRYQYVLRQGAKQSYFTEIKSLLKFMVASQMRQSSVSSVQEINDKLDEIYKNIEVKFNEYDPAHIKESRIEVRE